VFDQLGVNQDVLDYETAKALKKALFLGRALLRRLVAAGFADAASTKAAGAEPVRKALNHKGAFAALWAKLTEGEAPSTPARYPDATEAVVLKKAINGTAAKGELDLLIESVPGVGSVACSCWAFAESDARLGKDSFPETARW